MIDISKWDINRDKTYWNTPWDAVSFTPKNKEWNDWLDFNRYTALNSEEIKKEWALGVLKELGYKVTLEKQEVTKKENCPICGKKANAKSWLIKNEVYYCITCFYCGINSNYCHTIEEAIESWNKIPRRNE